MSDDNDLIRRVDAIEALKAANLPFGYGQAVHAITNVPAVQVAVKPLCSHINRDAQGVCWDCGYDARILAAIEPAPVTLAEAAKVEALVEAACGLLDAYSAIIGPGNPWGDSLRATIAAMKEG